VFDVFKEELVEVKSLVTDKMKTLFVEGTHFLSKPYTKHQLQDSFGDLLAT